MLSSKSYEIGNITRRNISGQTELDEDFTLFDTIANPSSTLFAERIEEREDKINRARYIKGFFQVLEKILTPEEFRFIKYRYTKNLPDKIIAGWLGLINPLKSIAEKVQNNPKPFARLKKLYPWEGAETFERVLLSKFAAIVKNPESEGAITLDKPTIKKLDYAAKTHEERMQYHLNYQESRRPYRNEYMRGYQAALSNSRHKLQEQIDDICRYLVSVKHALSVTKLNQKTTPDENEKIDKGIIDGCFYLLDACNKKLKEIQAVQNG